MNNTDVHFPHIEEPQVFRAALTYTEAQTGFTSLLIEKDYFCTLILRYLFNETLSRQNHIVFKGGTCLSKVYADFYRLSEDLDFVIPIDFDTGRQQRRTKIKMMKELFEKLPRALPEIEIKENLKGHNESRQYVGYIQYPSASMRKNEHIKIEIGLRENLLESPEIMQGRSIIQNPFTRKEYMPQFSVNAIALKEAYAEKMRAALTRKEPAIRDFFDVLYAQKRLNLDFSSDEFIRLVNYKLSVPGNGPIDVSQERKETLLKQVHTQLESVLRPSDFHDFDIEIAFRIVFNMAKQLSHIR